MGFSMEKHIRIYDDDTGSYLEIRPDSDGLGCYEIRAVEPDGKMTASVFIVPDQLPHLIKALQEL